MWFPLAFDLALLLVLLGLAILVMVVLRRINRPLNTEPASCGIVSLQRAKPEKAREILDSWDPRARLHAAFGLGFDYLFLALYGTTLAVGCVGSGEVLGSGGCPAGDFGVPLAWAAWLAAAFDAAENGAHFRMLRDDAVTPWATLARRCAITKIVLIIATGIYALAGLVAWILG